MQAEKRGRRNERGWSQKAPPSAGAAPLVAAPVTLSPVIGAEAPPKPTPISFALNEEQRRLWDQTVPQHPVLSVPGATPHGHALLALERRFAEQEMHALVPRSGPVLDVGGDPRRHERARRYHVWCAAPVLLPGDAARHAEYRSRRLVRVCMHPPDVCECAVRVWGESWCAAVSVHTAYYFTPEQIYVILKRTTAEWFASVLNVFEGERGSLYTYPAPGHTQASELVWRLVGPDTHVQVRGQAAPYVHRRQSWLRDGYWSDGSRALTWVLKRSVGFTRVFVFAPSPVMPVRGPCVEPDAELIRAARAAGFETVRYADDPVKLAFVTSDGGAVEVTRAAVNEIRAFVSNKARDATTRATLLSKARRILAIEDVHDGGVTAALVPWALERDVAAENAVAATVMHGPLAYFARAAHDRLVTRFSTLPLWGSTVAWAAARVTFRDVLLILLLAWTVGPTVGTAYVRHFGQAPLAAAPLEIDALVAAPIIEEVLRGYAPRAATAGLIIVETFRTAVYAVIADDPSHLPARMVGNSIHLALMAAVYLGVPTWARILLHAGYNAYVLRNIAYVHGGKLRADVCCQKRGFNVSEGRITILPEAGLCEPKFNLRPVGMVLRCAQPVVPRKCIHNAEVSVRNRACKQRVESVDSTAMARVQLAWRQFAKQAAATLSEELKAHALYAALDPMTQEAWIARFPGVRRCILEKAYREQASNKEMRHARGEIKVEKTIAAGNSVLAALADADTATSEDGTDFKLFDPRMITVFEPYAHVALGPSVLALTESLKHVWSINSTITYLAGFSANRLGEWFALVIASIEDPVFLSGDCSRMDSSYGVPAEDFWQDDYMVVRLRDPEALRALRATSGPVVVFVVEGIIYVIYSTNRSGRVDTTYRNTRTMGEALRPVLVAGARVGVGGDDSLVVVPRAHLEDAREALTFPADLGFRYTYSVHDNPFDAQLFSGRFWPSSTGWVYAPLIGRQLAKVYWRLGNVNDGRDRAWMRGVALSQAADYAHVPVMRAVVARTLRATEGVEPMPAEQSYRPHAECASEATPETFEMFAHLYGLSAQEVVTVEQIIYTLPRIDVYIDDVVPVLRHIVEVDLELC